MKEKFIKHYMRMAKFVGEDCNSCYSRKIGVVIVDPRANKVLGTGYNSPPRGVPHNDDPGYLEYVVWPQLKDEEKAKAVGCEGAGPPCPVSDCVMMNDFVKKYGNTRICPRKAIGAPSGARLELCSCAHAETNAIVNASNDLYGAEMFCWCGCPCVECTKLIINSGIKKVYIIDWGRDYSFGSRFLFSKAGVEVIEYLPDYYLSTA